MNAQEKMNKVKKNLTIRLVICLILAAVLILPVLSKGFAAKAAREAAAADPEAAVEVVEFEQWQMDAYKAMALAGVFFLVLAVVYLIPALIKAGKGDYGIMDDAKAKKELGKYVPAGEALQAVVYADGLQTKTNHVFGKCEVIDDELVPNEKIDAFFVQKMKFSTHGLYVGITDQSLLFTECEENKHAYSSAPLEMTAEEYEECEIEPVTRRIPLREIGTHAFPFASIQNCEIKKTALGCVECTVDFSDGSLLKFRVNKGAGCGMPDHKENCDKLVARLSDIKGM